MVQSLSSKGVEKRVRGLVESKDENLSSWDVKLDEVWKPLQVGVGWVHAHNGILVQGVVIIEPRPGTLHLIISWG